MYWIFIAMLSDATPTGYVNTTTADLYFSAWIEVNTFYPEVFEWE